MCGSGLSGLGLVVVVVRAMVLDKHYIAAQWKCCEGNVWHR